MAYLDQLFAALWNDYAAITPQVARVQKLLADRGETIVNDHIALRTFDRPAVAIEVIDRGLVAAGYQPADSYEFPAKKLIAYHYEHPDAGRPKVFISALLVDEFSSALRATVDELLSHLAPAAAAASMFLASGRPWPVSHATYQALAAESEYAAWLAAFGFRANHFTIDVGALKTVAGLAELDQLLVAEGLELNQSGGVIKGSPAQLLEQSSTVADAVEVEFTDGSFRVPACYYEFAKRYPMADGSLFQGFIAGSADKLFESTNRR